MFKSPNINGFEKTITSIGATILLIFGCLLFQELSDKNSQSSRDFKVGQIVQINGSAYKINLNTNIRSRVNLWSPIYKNEMLVTNENSRIELKLGKSQLTIGENSQLTVFPHQTSTNIEFSKGRFIVESPFKNQIGLVSSGEVFAHINSVEPCRWLILVDNQGLTIESINNSLTLTSSNGSTYTVHPNNRLNIDSSLQMKLSEPRLQALSPAYQDIFSTDEGIEFKWKSDGQSLEFQISGDPLFENPKKIKTQGLSSLRLDNLIDNNMFWRIVSRDGKSLVTPFSQIPVNPPALTLLETQNLEVAYQKKMKVNFSASSPSRSDHIWIQILDKLGNVVVNKTSHKILQAHRLSAGSYKIRAKAIYQNNIRSNWSNIIAITISEKLKPLSLPFTELPRVLLIKNQRYESDIYQFSTEEMQEELSKQAQFKHFFKPLQRPDRQFEIAFEDSNSTAWSKTELPTPVIYPGIYKYKYRYTSPGREASIWSKSNYLEIRLQAPYPLPIQTESSDDRFRKSKLELRWTPLLLTPYYEIQLAQSPKFERLDSFIAESDETEIFAYPGQKYYWRVRALNSEFRPISSFSEVDSFLIPLYEQDPLLAGSRSQFEGPSHRRPAVSTSAVSTGKLSNEVKKMSYFKSYWAWLSMGANYVSYQQNIESQGPVSFASYALPSTYLEVGARLSPKWMLRAMYKKSPGSIDNTKVGNQTIAYSWDVMGIEGLMQYRNHDSHKIFLLGGLQAHSQPMLTIQSKSTTKRVLSLLQNKITLASLGVEYAYLYSQDVRFSLNQKILYPLAASNTNGGQLSLSPQFFYDGSVGAQYQAWNATWLGFYWYGQVHRYGYKLKLPNESLNGQQDLFFSNLELRLGYDF